MTDNGAIGWDDEVSESDMTNESQERDEFVVLPNGTYPFEVNKVERGSFSGSDKLPACNMVKVGIILDGGDKGRSYATVRFYMHTRTLWRIYSFLTAVGLHKKGEGAVSIPWGKVTRGLTGRCEVTIRTWKDKQSNDVTKWIEDTAEAKSASKTEDEMPPF